MKIRVAMFAAALALGACASHQPPLPVASTVCFVLPTDMPEAAGRYVKARGAEYLADYGFRLVQEGCDVTVTFDRLTQSRADVVRASAFGVSTSGRWSEEGFITVVGRDGAVLVNAEPLDLRDYSSMQKLLEHLAWELAKPATWLFQPPKRPG